MKTLLLAAVALCATAQLAAQDYVVQIAVYDRPVVDAHFGDLDGKLLHSKDQYGFHRYFVGTFDARTADQRAADFRARGFNAVNVIGEGEFDQRCSCFLTERPVEVTNELRLRSIFFDFDKSDLRPEARERLDQLVQRLRNDASLKVDLMAHTDAKGSDEYNEALSQRRADAARRYVISRGIAASRVTASTFGERSPIARNQYADGNDAATGRQLNRRVELIVRDSDGLALDIVEPIEVPEDLREGR